MSEPSKTAGRSGRPRRRRNGRVLACFNAEEMARVQRLIEDSGLSGSALVRNSLLGIPLPGGVGSERTTGSFRPF